MAQTIQLVPLLCVRCNTSIPANLEEVAWACAQCGQGNMLDVEKGLVPVEIHYSAGLAPSARGKPFWVVDAQVSQQRQTYSGNEEREAQKFWAQPRRFYVPAFECPLETLLDLGQKLLLHPPALQPGAPAPFEPVILHMEDVQAAVDFIVMAVEAGRKDMLKEVEFSAMLSTPELWVMP
jgi:hypothetical protein